MEKFYSLCNKTTPELPPAPNNVFRIIVVLIEVGPCSGHGSYSNMIHDYFPTNTETDLSSWIANLKYDVYIPIDVSVLIGKGGRDLFRQLLTHVVNHHFKDVKEKRIVVVGKNIANAISEDKMSLDHTFIFPLDRSCPPHNNMFVKQLFESFS